MSSLPSGRRRAVIAAAGIAALFAFRLFYGLSSEFFFEDETQIYLIGLRYFATGTWPYFGPDVVWTKSEIPGALQGLVVGLPLKIAPFPEAPFVLLNLLSLAAIAAYAWYITARLPGLPKWLVWGWIGTLPWTLELSTHVLNSSYVLAGSLVFFLGFFEAVPALRRDKIPEPLAFGLMGIAIPWVMQFHMAWALLPAYAGLAWLLGLRGGVRRSVVNTAAFLCGLLVFGSLVIPTFVTYGLHGGSGGTLRNLHPHAVSPYIALSTLARFFSFASLEVWRFTATDDGKRQMFFMNNLWIVPLFVIPWLAGLWQPFWMLREWFRRESRFPEWPALKWLVVFTVLLVYTGYWFVMEPPQAHAFYVTAPIAFMFAAYSWTFVDSPMWRRVAAGLMAANVAFHIGQAAIQLPEKSMYRDRDVVVAAINHKEPQMFAHRRPFAPDPGPISLEDPSRPYDSAKDIQLADKVHTHGWRGVSLWTVTLKNLNERVAYRDVIYLTRYLNERNEVLVERRNVIKFIFQPGTATTLVVNDSTVHDPFTTATIEMLGAEALLPIPTKDD